MFCLRHNILSLFCENGVLVARDLNFRLCRTFCNNISLTFHPMQDSAIFCTFFPVFLSIAQNISKLLLNFHQAWKLVPSGRWSLCIITASPCALRREGVQKNENKLSHLPFRVVFWRKTLVFFSEISLMAFETPHPLNGKCLDKIIFLLLPQFCSALWNSW